MKQINKDLEWIEEMVTHYAHNPQDPDFGFFAFCQVPDLMERIRWEARPLHIRLRDWFLSLKWRFQPSDKQIPF